MKKKRIIGIISLFMCICLVGVGFAAWVITGEGDSKIDGSIEVTTVTDKRIGISDLAFVTKEGSTEDAKSNISFLGSREQQESDWLKIDNGENLTVYLKGTVKAESPEFVDTENPVVTLSVLNNENEDGSSVFKGLQAFDDPTDEESSTVELIKALPTQGNGIVAKIGENKLRDGKFEADINITITFAWGSAFEGKNPQVYYNDGKTSLEYGDEAYARLNAIHGLDGFSYKVTVKIKNPTLGK